MTKTQNSKHYDLEDRTLRFAKRIANYIDNLQKTISNVEIGKQLMRSAGSIGANYIEANESLSKKDFLMRIKISRKESKESRYWLQLSEPGINQGEKDDLIRESMELMKIFGSIVTKSQSLEN
ncbi:four helix bundle protein [Candidatus Microgenomates bacterium]|nr:four helix bundle protein [Candidatus Microgenomates bacterium]